MKKSRWYLVSGVFAALFSAQLMAADIAQVYFISCVSEDSSVQGRHGEYNGEDRGKKVNSWFAKWLFSENFSEIKSKIQFVWTPKTDKPPKIEISTNEKPHNSIGIRSRTKHSVIFTSSASNPLTSESWLFALNFKLETMVATRVQSNVAGVKGELLTYNCAFSEEKEIQ